MTQHRDGNIEIGAGATDGSGTQLGFTDNTDDGGLRQLSPEFNDGVGATFHEFTEVSSTRWTTPGPDRHRSGF